MLWNPTLGSDLCHPKRAITILVVFTFVKTNKQQQQKKNKDHIIKFEIPFKQQDICLLLFETNAGLATWGLKGRTEGHPFCQYANGKQFPTEGQSMMDHRPHQDCATRSDFAFGSWSQKTLSNIS